jgi:ketosteroid isomerase-like protein
VSLISWSVVWCGVISTPGISGELDAMGPPKQLQLERVYNNRRNMNQWRCVRKNAPNGENSLSDDHLLVS